MLSQVKSNSLLVEFLTEELPPINLEANIGGAFSQALAKELNGFISQASKIHPFVAPRRFGCLIENIDSEQQNITQLKRGPHAATALKDGNPTQALLGFAKSCATDWQNLEIREDGYFYFEVTIKGKALGEVINDAVNNALKKIPIAKAMRWADTDYQFIRPVHNVMALLNEQVLPVTCFGLTSNKKTKGHRFMSNGDLAIDSATNYLTDMYESGKVIASFAARKELIKYNLEKKATELGLIISHIDGLIEEVTALVEWPEILVGSFDEKFLKVPQECLILSMAKNQKYFALVDSKGKLSNKFLFVANLQSPSPEVIIAGNQKVLSARLADAEFFFEFDKRTKLADFVTRTENVVYHNKLGSQFERISRLQKIAVNVAPMLGVDIELAKKTAYLLKADLVTEMVGEFPELQGIMGKYYALNSGEGIEVANAIEKHYYPRFSGDELPDSNLAIVMALADKLESLVGIWGIGLIPSGDKDPYALRRAALGVIRILLNNDLDLKALLEASSDAFEGKNLADNTLIELYQFIISRLANYLTSVEGYPTKVVNAVLNSTDLDYSSTFSKKIHYIPGLLSILVTFAEDSNNLQLFEANKRIENILRKNQDQLTSVSIKPELFKEPSELALYQLFANNYANGETFIKLKEQSDWHAYFKALSGFDQALNAFFTDVMVMADDLALRQNRLSLLAELYRYFNLVCKLSELA